MFNFLDRTDFWGLIFNVAAVILLVTVVNAIVFSFDWGDFAESAPDVLAPPGWVLALVWTTLFIFMGAARWLAVKSENERTVYHSRLIFSLVALCALYPFYTLGLQNNVMGLIGNIIIILLAGWTAWQIAETSRLAAGLIAMIVIWVLFASGIVVRELFAQAA